MPVLFRSSGKGACVPMALTAFFSSPIYSILRIRWPRNFVCAFPWWCADRIIGFRFSISNDNALFSVRSQWMLGLMEKNISPLWLLFLENWFRIQIWNCELLGVKKITFAERALVYCAKCVFALRAPGIYAGVIANIWKQMFSEKSFSIKELWKSELWGRGQTLRKHFSIYREPFSTCKQFFLTANIIDRKRLLIRQANKKLFSYFHHV